MCIYLHKLFKRIILFFSSLLLYLQTYKIIFDKDLFLFFFFFLQIGKYTCKTYKHITMEHAELVAEMIHVERLTTQERLHLARHRRLQQLKVWRQREKEWLRHQTRHTSNKRHIYFSDSVMLLEAAARNDIDEGKKEFCTYIKSKYELQSINQ